MQATISITLTDQEAEDILVTALEGGINYWADVISSGRYNGVMTAHIRPTEGDNFGQPFIHTGHIQQGVDRLCAKYSARHHSVLDLLNDNVDADTADLVVQFALFGKMVYA
jgi:hypothetical protein